MISSHIERLGAWEEDKVTDVLRAMETYRDAVFIGTVLLIQSASLIKVSVAISLQMIVNQVQSVCI